MLAGMPAALRRILVARQAELWAGRRIPHDGGSGQSFFFYFFNVGDDVNHAEHLTGFGR
jgi:hypothetical protein